MAILGFSGDPGFTRRAWSRRSRFRRCSSWGGYFYDGADKLGLLGPDVSRVWFLEESIMSGAIAGTAILRCRPTRQLDTVTVTVNDICNLRCPHCYLQTAGAPFNESIIETVCGAPGRHVAIVGKEPFVDAVAISRCARIVHSAMRNGKTASVITNGQRLLHVPLDLLSRLAYIDISFDGGPLTYEKYRRGSYARLVRGVRRAADMAALEVNALHVLSDATIDAVDDMMRVADIPGVQHIMFSLYVPTENVGTNGVTPVSLPVALRTLATSFAFMNTPRAFLLLDLPVGIERQSLDDAVRKLGLTQKVRIIAEDPLLYGILRVTYDGFVLTPLDSLHPQHYSRRGIRLADEQRDLSRIYTGFITGVHAA